MNNNNNHSGLKAIILILAIALIIFNANNILEFFNLGGCSSDKEKNVKTNEYINSIDRFDMYKVNHSYNQLTNNTQRDVYKHFEYCVGKITNELNEDYYKTESFDISYKDYDDDRLGFSHDLNTAYEAFYEDNPQDFWVCGYDRDNDDKSKTSSIYLRSRYTADTVERMKNDLNSDIMRFYSSIPYGLSNYYLEKYVHDYLIDNCEYNKDIASVRGDSDSKEIRKNNPEIGTAYGAIHNGDAVCNGYAQAFQLLCNCVGIDCVYIVGGTGNDSLSWLNDTLHAWNAVNLYGNWYLVDSTWDDQNEIADRYVYFNITTKQISEDHSAISMDKDGRIVLVGRTNVFLPECTDTKYNYYVYDDDCAKITNIEGDQVGREFLRILNSGKNTLTMYLDPAYINFKSAKKLMFENGDKKYMNRYLNYVYEKSSRKLSSYTYWTFDQRNAVVVRLNK